MAKTYNQINKVKEKFRVELEKKDAEILTLQEKLEKSEAKVAELRKQLYDAGEGKGERNRLEKKITAQERENKTLQNQLKDLDGSRLISSFSKERQELIKKIRKLTFKNAIFDRLAYKFKSGLDNVIEIAFRIKNNAANDLDYYTFVFRDDIVGLFEKMLKTLLGKRESSATKYLVNLSNGNYKLPSEYYRRIPKLKDKTILENILQLINLQSTGYHGTERKYKKVIEDKETNEIKKYDRFLNLDNKSQLDAIFTLLEFMYDVFTNDKNEVNLLNISSEWFKTI